MHGPAATSAGGGSISDPLVPLFASTAVVNSLLRLEALTVTMHPYPPLFVSLFVSHQLRLALLFLHLLTAQNRNLPYLTQRVLPTDHSCSRNDNTTFSSLHVPIFYPHPSPSLRQKLLPMSVRLTRQVGSRQLDDDKVERLLELIAIVRTSAHF